MEFRIWDIKNKKWIPRDQLTINLKLFYFISTAGEVVEASYEGVIPSVCIMQKEMYEVSQYIGRKDNAGVKVFTGDRINIELNGTNVFTIEFSEGEYIAVLPGETKPFNFLRRLGSLSESNGFTIIGNKWEGLHAAEAKAPIEPVCDSTVQQQNKNDTYFDIVAECVAAFKRDHPELRFSDKEITDLVKDSINNPKKYFVFKYPKEQESESFKEARCEFLQRNNIGREYISLSDARSAAKKYDFVFGPIKEAANKGRLSVIVNEKFIDEAVKFSLVEMGYKIKRETMFHFENGIIPTNNWIISWIEETDSAQ